MYIHFLYDFFLIFYLFINFGLLDAIIFVPCGYCMMNYDSTIKDKNYNNGGTIQLCIFGLNTSIKWVDSSMKNLSG